MTAAHLDQEALSAALDGEATAAERGHLATCEDCRRGLDSVRAVARAVAAPVTPRGRLATDAAIRAVLGMADADLAQAGAGPADAGTGLADAGAGLAAAGTGPAAAGTRLADVGAGLAGPGAGAGLAEAGVPSSRWRGRASGAGGRWPAARRWAVAAVLVSLLGGAGLLALAARGSGRSGPKSAVSANGVIPGVGFHRPGPTGDPRPGRRCRLGRKRTRDGQPAVDRGGPATGRSARPGRPRPPRRRPDQLVAPPQPGRHFSRRRAHRERLGLRRPGPGRRRASATNRCCVTWPRSAGGARTRWCSSTPGPEAAGRGWSCSMSDCGLLVSPAAVRVMAGDGTRVVSWV